MSYSNLKLEGAKALMIKNIPCKILELGKSSAYVQDLITGAVSKQHFHNLHCFQYNNDAILPDNWDINIQNSMRTTGFRHSTRQTPSQSQEDTSNNYLNQYDIDNINTIEHA